MSQIVINLGPDRPPRLRGLDEARPIWEGPAERNIKWQERINRWWKKWLRRFRRGIV